MAIRTLPDGSKLDTDTGDLLDTNPTREAAARRASGPMNPRAPIPNKGQQIMQVRQTPSGKTTIAPVQQLAISPNSAMGEVSDTTKRMMLTGLIVAAAFGAVWFNSKMKKAKDKTK